LATKLSRYAEGVMEAAWLAAVMLVPVFFNIYSSRIFEPDKITMLRTLALVTMAAWLVKLFEQGGFRWERIPRADGWFKSIMRVPLIAPVFALALIYILATIFSVTPYTSLWGSYQRLQGTYTMFSYLLIFAALVVNLRHRSQVQRLISVAILSSLPVSLYGVLQRYRADPVPWGGDVTNRIASTMGNSIFVAAYLVIVCPLVILRAVESFEAMLNDRGQLWPNFSRATAYIFILALQLIAIYFSGSRGPWLGLGASLIVIWLGLSLIWGKRWLTISGVALALFAATFLLLLNLPNTPLEDLRSRPEFGRLGQLLDPESRTGRVRTLIWEGAAELVAPHEPLEFPDGRQDSFNFLRPLIGYGPESMYVTYNRFYRPELTQVEKRNASPDRSHNETWDSLVITGVLGLGAYLTLFGTLLYFGLKWLGLVPGKRERNLYLLLYVLGGALSTVIFVSWGGLKFLGVALPFGMVLGVVLYMILISLFSRFPSGISETHRLRAYILLGLLAAVTAHFVEINFGIAIAATRTYFWVYAALLLLVGFILPQRGEWFEFASAVEHASQETNEKPAEKPHDRRSSGAGGRRKSTARRAAARPPSGPPWLYPALFVGLIVGLLLTILGYEFVSNASREPSAIGLVVSSLTRSVREGSRNGILPFMLTTWLIGSILMASEGFHQVRNPHLSGNNNWLKALVVGAFVSISIALVFWLWNAAGLAALGRDTARNIEGVLAQVRESEGILTTFYVQVFLLVFGLALLLPADWPVVPVRNRAVSTALAAGLLLAAFGFAAYSNLRVIQADIAFKTADLFARPESWPASIAIYNRANALAPNEDYYYLFLGRAYLEYAKTLPDNPEREQLIEQARRDLLKAQEINPLNTDHTANLARLHSLWATFTKDENMRLQRARASEDYFAKALSLSPNSARLWDEWAVLYLNILDQSEQARDRLERALLIDPFYDWTYALLGDYYSHEVAEKITDQPEKKTEALEKAANYYNEALVKGEGSATSQMLYSYAISLGGIQAQLGRFDEAIVSYEKALEFLPSSTDSWRVEFALAQLYSRMGDPNKALEYARAALSQAPEDQQPVINSLIAKLGETP
jgi:tetratricopeptide (TPR) repeat protein